MNHTRIVPFILLATAFALPTHADPAPSLDPDTVLAANYKAKVTNEDLQAELSRIPAKDQFEFLLSRQRLATMVENILINKTLAAEARESGLEKKRSIQAEIRNQEEKVLAKYRGQEIQAKAPRISYENKARELFVASPERFVRPAQIDTWHVLITMVGRTRAEALKRAEEIRAKLLAGASPADIAAEYSDDPSKSRNGGALGYAIKSTFDHRFVAAAEKLKVGEFSGPVETEFGIHIIQLRGLIPESKSTYEEVKPSLILEAENMHIQGTWEAYINGIRGHPSTTVNTEALDSLRPKLPAIPPSPQSTTEPVSK